MSHPIEPERYAWPTAEIDPVSKMRALAAAMPFVAVDETVFDVPFERFWSFIADLENNTARFEGTVTRARILERSGDRLRLQVGMPGGLWTNFDVVLQPGWCLMQSSLGHVGMAARPEGPNRTRFIHLEGARILGRFARPYFRWNIRQDFRRLREILELASDR
jgi:hypothetical protein